MFICMKTPIFHRRCASLYGRYTVNMPFYTKKPASDEESERFEWFWPLRAEPIIAGYFSSSEGRICTCKKNQFKPENHRETSQPIVIVNRLSEECRKTKFIIAALHVLLYMLSGPRIFSNCI